MTKLNDTQLILLSVAAARDEGDVYPLPAWLTDAGARVGEVVEGLLKRGLSRSGGPASRTTLLPPHSPVSRAGGAGAASSRAAVHEQRVCSAAQRTRPLCEGSVSLPQQGWRTWRGL